MSKKLFKDIQTDISKMSEDVKEQFSAKIQKVEEDTGELKDSMK